MPTTTTRPPTRYKGFSRLEEDARRRLGGLLDGCNPVFGSLPPMLREDMIQRLRPAAQKAILQALEGRTQEQDELFGYDWEEALVQMRSDPARQQAARHLLERLPEIAQALAQPEITRRDLIEWLYEQTADRMLQFAPYFTQEEKELHRWKNECPEAHTAADRLARKGAHSFQDRSRPAKAAPPAATDLARELVYTAQMIAARKLYQLATGTNEYYETHKASVGLKVPPALQAQFGSKAYVRLGLATKPVPYRLADERAWNNFQSMLESTMLRNLQEKVCPWTADQALTQKLDCNLMAKVYYGIIQPSADAVAEMHPHAPTLEKLGPDRYRLLGFRDDIAPGPARLLEEFIHSNGSLQQFLNEPGVADAFRLNRIDKNVVALCLNVSAAHEIVRVTKTWNPALEFDRPTVADQARSALPHIMADLARYHDALMVEDYLSVRGRNHFKERMLEEHLKSVTPKERGRLESFYKPMAVVIVSKDEGSPDSIPAHWQADRAYRDPVTGADFTDYLIDQGPARAIVCLARGASAQTGQEAVQRLLDLAQPARINDPAARIRGVRISELSYHELTASCLRPASIARMQFYTSFSASQTLQILKGNAEEPTVENTIEALKPCFILHYSDDYCRVKPAEMVRVKYRTPTGEKKNPCWDASRVMGGMKEADPKMRERLEDTRWGLILIEGEKKAALLAQMMLDLELPWHVQALPGVWMGLVRGNLVEEIARFRMRDGAAEHRKCQIFFDNDKAFKAGVTHAILETAAALQKAGAQVFIPNLPFGKNLKGADDFALARCRRGKEIDYGPLLSLIENAQPMPEQPRRIKYPRPEEEREINRFLHQAEHIHDLQERLRTGARAAELPELRELFLLQAPYQMRMRTQSEALAYFDSLDAKGRMSVLAMVLKDNPALRLLRSKCSQIPDFEQGSASRDPAPEIQPEAAILTPELFMA